MPEGFPEAVLFDLDGTFAGYRTDLGAALNRLRRTGAAAGCDDVAAPLRLAAGAWHVSRRPWHAARPPRTMLPSTSDFVHYQQALCVETRLFPGIAP